MELVKMWSKISGIAIFISTLFFCLSEVVTIEVCTNDSMKQNTSNDFKFYTRSEWNARPVLQKNSLSTPVPYVVIHHSLTPAACNNSEECFRAMRSMQDFHIDGRGWWDIGYNFAVGSDGAVYEGRGWQTLGAHSLHFNTLSIGICLIGDWTELRPPNRQLDTAKSLIKSGVSLGFIRSDYKVVGHRQVRDTECPGQALFEEIKGWPNYSSFPESVAQLELVKELPDSVKELLSNKIVT